MAPCPLGHCLGLTLTWSVTKCKGLPRLGSRTGLSSPSPLTLQATGLGGSAKGGHQRAAPLPPRLETPASNPAPHQTGSRKTPGGCSWLGCEVHSCLQPAPTGPRNREGSVARAQSGGLRERPVCKAKSLSQLRPGVPLAWGVGNADADTGHSTWTPGRAVPVSQPRCPPTPHFTCGGGGGSCPFPPGGTGKRPGYLKVTK